MEMDARWRRLSELDDLEDFDGYAIDVKGGCGLSNTNYRNFVNLYGLVRKRCISLM